MKDWFFVIITPSIQRDSLEQTCQSVDMQTFKDWIHVIACDCRLEDFNLELADRVIHDQRVLNICGIRHNNGGNSCRHNQYGKVNAKWWIYLDDDNHLAHENVLQDIHDA